MIRPLHKNVILRKELSALESASGIVLQTASRRPDTAVVIAVGPDVEDSDFGPGDVVIYKAKDPVVFAEGADEYVILPDDAILAVQEAASGD